MAENLAYAYDAFDAVANVFEPDVVLPSQFFGVDVRGLDGGERKLMAAILSDGVEAYIADSSKFESSTPVSDAIQWVETKDLQYVFSFDNVCECLGIDADYLRLGLSRYLHALKMQRLQGSATGSRTWKKIRRPRK